MSRPISSSVLSDISNIKSSISSYESGNPEVHMGEIRKKIQSIVQYWKSLPNIEGLEKLSIQLKEVIDLADQARKKKDSSNGFFLKVFKSVKRTLSLSEYSWDKGKKTIESSLGDGKEIVILELIKDCAKKRILNQKRTLGNYFYFDSFRFKSKKSEDPQTFPSCKCTQLYSRENDIDIISRARLYRMGKLNGQQIKAKLSEIEVFHVKSECFQSIFPLIKRAEEDLELLQKIKGELKGNNLIEEGLLAGKKVQESIEMMHSSVDKEKILESRNSIILNQKKIQQCLQSVRNQYADKIQGISLRVFFIPPESQFYRLNAFLKLIDKLPELDSTERGLTQEESEYFEDIENTIKDPNLKDLKGLKDKISELQDLIMNHLGNAYRGKDKLEGPHLDKRRLEIRSEVLSFLLSLHKEIPLLPGIDALENSITNTLVLPENRINEIEIERAIAELKEYEDSVQVSLVLKIQNVIDLLRATNCKDEKFLKRMEKKIENVLKKEKKLYAELKENFIGLQEIDEIEKNLIKERFKSMDIIKHPKDVEKIEIAKLEVIQYIRRLKSILLYQKQEGGAPDQLEEIIDVFMIGIKERLEELRNLEAWSIIKPLEEILTKASQPEALITRLRRIGTEIKQSIKSESKGLKEAQIEVEHYIETLNQLNETQLKVHEAIKNREIGKFKEALKETAQGFLRKLDEMCFSEILSLNDLELLCFFENLGKLIEVFDYKKVFYFNLIKEDLSNYIAFRKEEISRGCGYNNDNDDLWDMRDRILQNFNSMLSFSEDVIESRLILEESLYNVLTENIFLILDEIPKSKEEATRLISNLRSLNLTPVNQLANVFMNHYIKINSPGVSDFEIQNEKTRVRRIALKLLSSVQVSTNL